MFQLYNVELQNNCDRLKQLLTGMFEKDHEIPQT
jgi:hypothetical protein